MFRNVIVMFRNVIPADSILRYREGDFNETVYIKGDEKRWTEYINLCREYREDSSIPSLKELQNEEIVTKDGFAKSGFIMFEDSYDEEQFSDPKELIVEIIKKEGPKLAKDLQARTKYNSRSKFLAEVLKPLMDADIIYRDGNLKSPTALIKIKY